MARPLSHDAGRACRAGACIARCCRRRQQLEHAAAQVQGRTLGGPPLKASRQGPTPARTATTAPPAGRRRCPAPPRRRRRPRRWQAWPAHQIAAAPRARHSGGRRRPARRSASPCAAAARPCTCGRVRVPSPSSLAALLRCAQRDAGGDHLSTSSASTARRPGSALRASQEAASGRQPRSATSKCTTPARLTVAGEACASVSASKSTDTCRARPPHVGPQCGK